MDIAEFARRIPKAELHLHLEGTLEPELKLALAHRNNIPLTETTAAEVRDTYTFTDLPSFLAVYYPSMEVLQTEDDFFDLAMAYLNRASAQGVRHVEMFFDPQSHTSRGVQFSTVIRGYRRAFITARRSFAIQGELIMCFLRDMDPSFAMATLMEALPHRDWIIGVGLDSDERGNPPAKFAAVMARARAEGFLVTVHCDIDQQDSAEHIRQAIHELQVDRIDHGTNIVEDRRLLREAKSRGLGLTVCPLSNGFVSDAMKTDEIMQLFDAGLLVSINSDDPAYFGGYIGDNYAALAKAADLTREQLVRFARNSFESSWLSPRIRDHFLEEIDAFVAAHPD